MNPGLPGTGIGGLFYILVALWMPVCEVLRRWQGDATRRGSLVARQFAIAVGVVAVMAGVFWALDALLLHRVAAPAGGHHAVLSLRVSALLVTSSVLAAVLGTVECLRLCLRFGTLRHAAR
ncbi:MAG TPA: hypothetical protein VJO54_07675 [Burkholderiales bacterium]|nr:hypothetical protein [Burkholderiales bacterium]